MVDVAASVAAGSADGAEPAAPQRSVARRRAWLAMRLAAVAVVAYVAAQVVLANSAELTGATGYLQGASPAWLAVAVAVEASAYLASGLLHRRLLRAGGLRVALGPLAAISLAANAINTAVPGGGALATVYVYRQFRRRGADEALTTWILVAFAALSAFTLAMLALAGLIVSGPDGGVGGLWPLLALLVVGPAVAFAFLLRPRLLAVVGAPVLLRAQRITGRPRRPVPEVFDGLVGRLETVRPGRRDWLVAMGYSVLNWSADLACLLASFAAVGTAIPWRGVLVAYGAAQVAVNVPITPGGLGVVEGSLTVALVAYGGSTDGTVAAVLLFRVISFWAALPSGWLAWLGLQIAARSRAAPRVEAT